MSRKAWVRALLAPVLAVPIAAQDPSAEPIAAALACDRAGSTELAARGRTALAGGDPVMAATLFHRALEACPSERGLRMEISRALTAQRRFGEGVAAAEEYLRDEPESVPGLLTLANALFMAQRWEECRPLIERVLKADPDNAAALLLKGNNEYLLDNSGEAENALIHLLDKNPGDVDAAYTLGRIYYMENRAEYAMAQFQRVLKLDQTHYRAWDNLALCYDALGDTEMAIRHFLTAIKLVERDHPDYHWPYANLADLLLRQNRFEEAYQAATQAAKRNPYSARNFFLGGKALTKLGREADAVKWLERSAQLDPDYPDSLYALGQLYMKLGEKERAATVLKQFRTAKAKAPKKRR